MLETITKTIKTTKHMKLDELINHVWENNLYPVGFKSEDGFKVYFDNYGAIKLENDYIFKRSSTFEVEFEETITEDTKFDLLIKLYEDTDVLGGYDTLTYYDLSIKSILKNDINKHYPIKEIHALIGGKLELIWERDAQ